jgi:hypothetical protein
MPWKALIELHRLQSVYQSNHETKTYVLGWALMAI